MTSTEPPAPRPARVEFRDFDNEQVFKSIQNQVMSETAKNFVVEFGADGARVAVDLGLAEFEELLDSRVDPNYPVRWINIWGPGQQRDIITRIGCEYDFSERLINTMKFWDVTKNAALRDQKSGDMGKSVKPGAVKAKLSGRKDIEQGLNSRAEVAQATSPLPQMSRGDLALHRLLHGPMNHTTIDQGDDFICFGAHWLHMRPEYKQEDSTTLQMPRHWAWYTLCYSEHTVLSVQEAPDYSDPPPGADKKGYEEDELKSMRSNTFKALVQLSKCGFGKYDNDILSQKTIRLPPRAKPDSRHPRRKPTMASQDGSNFAQEGSSNLLYYLFEEYTAALHILDQSNRVLANLTERVLHSGSRKTKEDDTSAIVKSLYQLSKELRRFKQLFESYKTLIQRITGRQSATGLDALVTSTAAGPRETQLTQKARDRFERLSDRMQLQMLNTIQEYLEEKSALSDTYFNLTAQKDSRATARLTRSATLLAKLSVLFLPVSFVTSYFSVQIPNLFNDATVWTYWTTFGGVIGVSFVLLFFFSRFIEYVSGKMDDVTKRGWRAVRNGVRWKGWRRKGWRGGDGDRDGDGEEKDGDK